MSDPAVVAVFGSSTTEPGSVDWSEAEKAGRLLAESGIAVVTGGYGGSMEAVSKGGAEAGGMVIGVISPTLFPGRLAANSHVGDLHQAETLAERIGTMIDRACGVIALPGSIGTATELLVAWNQNHILRHHGGGRIPTVAVGPGWRELHRLMTDEIGAHPADIDVVDDVEQAVQWLLEQPEVNRYLATR